MFRPGPKNLITDIAGLKVGHATNEAVRTGVTVLLCESAWTAAVDVRGGGPGTRETEALAPENLVGRTHAVVLAGGSVFGLAAADGVATALSAQGIGLQLRPHDRGGAQAAGQSLDERAHLTIRGFRGVHEQFILIWP